MFTSPEPVLPSEQFRGLERANELSHHGVDLLACGDTLSAAQSFREAITIDPEHLEAHHGLIRALCDAEQFEAAVAAAMVLTALTPNDPLAHTSLSIALQKAGQIPEAEAAAGRARILEWKQQLAVTPAKDSLEQRDPPSEEVATTSQNNLNGLGCNSSRQAD